MDFEEEIKEEVEEYRKPNTGKTIAIIVLITIAIGIGGYRIYNKSSVDEPSIPAYTGESESSVESNSFASFLHQSNLELEDGIKDIDAEELSNRISEDIFSKFKVDLNGQVYHITSELNEDATSLLFIAQPELNDSVNIKLGEVDLEDKEQLDEYLLKINSIYELIYMVYIENNPTVSVGSITSNIHEGEVMLLDEKEGKNVYAKYSINVDNDIVYIKEVK